MLPRLQGTGKVLGSHADVLAPEIEGVASCRLLCNLGSAEVFDGGHCRFVTTVGWTTVADLWERLGQLPLERIRLTPPAGMAVDLRTRTTAVYSSPEQPAVRGEGDVLTGGNVLPGFKLPLRELFAEIEGK